ncbi:MAG: DUF1490 domain-containing protein [Atopobiaceae bacterium]|nr:DUF1490 domain-containing protein [Atopobiaceae bacterium]
MFGLSHVAYVAGGALVAVGFSALGKKGKIHDCAVKATATGMRATDAVQSVAQDIVDEASDINAEARRQARIDAAVRERLAALEEGIRAEVTAEIDQSAEA